MRRKGPPPPAGQVAWLRSVALPRPEAEGQETSTASFPAGPSRRGPSMGDRRAQCVRAPPAHDHIIFRPWADESSVVVVRGRHYDVSNCEGRHMLITVLAAMATPSPGITCPVNHIQWACEAEWVSSLPERQQTVVIIILRKRANDVAAEWLKNTSYATKADKCRFSARGGFVQGVLSEAATQPALRAYLNYELELAEQFARKQITVDQFKTALSGSAFPSSVLQIVNEDFEVVSRAYPRELEQAKIALLDAAKNAADLVCKR